MNEALAKFAELRREGMAYNEALEESGYAKLLAEKQEKKKEKPIESKLSEEEFTKILSEDEKVSPQLAKRIIDNLSKRGLDIENMNSVLWEIKEKICEEALLEKLNKTTDEDIGKAIDDMLDMRWGDYSEEIISEITLSEEFDENKEFELITTAKQTDHRYGDFEYSKADLETMAKNFNENIVGTEIPVDLNHDPEHIAYAWIKPGSMKVKESSSLDWHFSLYAQLYKYTPEGKDMVSTGKVRYFSLQIQNVFTKFVDKTKKTFNLVIRALALTNMPVIKDMAPTLSEGDLSINHISNMKTLEELQAQNAQILSEKEATDKALAEKDAENKRLSEELAKVSAEKREAFLSEQVESLCLSEGKTIAFKGGEKEKILDFVKTLSEDQATAYFALHTNILTSVELGEEGDTPTDGNVGDEAASEVLDAKAKELASKEGISYGKAMDRVLSENPDLAAKAA